MPWLPKAAAAEKMRPGGARGYNVRVTAAAASASAYALAGLPPPPATPEPETVGLLAAPPPLEPEEAVGVLLGVQSPTGDEPPAWEKRASHTGTGRAGRWASGQAAHAAGLRTPTGGAR